MARASLAIIAEAAQDPDLWTRIEAAAAEIGVTSARAADRLREIVATPFTADATDSVASVYEYAASTYEPPLRPGQNPAAVTDDHIRTAVARVFAAETPSA